MVCADMMTLIARTRRKIRLHAQAYLWRKYTLKAAISLQFFLCIY